MLIDTHCHIGMLVDEKQKQNLDPEDIPKISEIIKVAKNNNVTKIINIGTNVIDSQYYVEVSREFQECYATLGIHPNDLTDHWQSEIKFFDKILSKKNHKNKIVGIGETGLDFHYSGYDINKQKDLFKAQIELALKYDLALSIHSRDAAQETLEVLSIYKKDSIRGTIHCFSYDIPFAEEAINLGFVLGIGGTITYPKNQVLRDTVDKFGLENIVLETDAPFLSPQVIRGKQNSPVNITLIADYLSGYLDESPEIIAKKTTENVKRIFRI